jgi:ligand-binding SRPBCC domain-containing protein
MQAKEIRTTTIINKSLSEVFEFFSKAENLNKLTPPKVHFTILTPLPIPMFPGQIIKYRIKLFGIPFFWKTEITAWNPPFKFEDKQLSGPYVIWNHQHLFKEVDGKTEMTDIVTYKSKGWILAPFLHWLFVDKNVNEIFAYREKRLDEIFGNN